MPKVKGIYENGVVRPVEKLDVPEKGEVEILYEKKAKKRKKRQKKFPCFKAKDLEPLIGIISVGGDSVEDSERYYE